ncbi:Sensor-type histidine kinase PrrB [Actinomadura rubteroloni]|uniref:Signal transduction histidine-protein kinase/phosphatase MprB n=1 Tax=Actinomadura rubteroloni TaxID=1926885 RepID=A0A2P4UR17_9ACTN|nr:HAMP domain-containing sensor histidine kinase [Actinomadura rubteroloni]POM27499.1 Sensor-type histidine kinase PrrB [Actinomadura rubteroloni]
MERPPGTPLRRRLLVTIAGITAVAVALLIVPLAVAVQLLYRAEAVATLERDAARVAAGAGNGTAPAARELSPHLVVGLYRTDGVRVSGAGPSVSRVAAAARDGRSHEAGEGRALAVTTPVPSRTGPGQVVRVALPTATVRARTVRTWLLMGAFALVIVGLAAGVAWNQSRRLARPLERLTRAAQALGDGDFTVRADPSGLREADAAGRALEVTARRLGSMLERERAFSADVSHQLRTPLTGLLLGLESALERPGADLRSAARTAVRRGERMRDIIDDLLLLARDAGPDRAPLDVPALLDELRARWEGLPLATVVHGPLPTVHAKTSALRQILDVLVDNAREHGGGRITVEASDIGGGLAFDVADEGPGVTDPEDEIFTRRSASGNGHGIGLALARSLAEAEGGRLVLRRPAPPIFTLLLPATRDLH